VSKPGRRIPSHYGNCLISRRKDSLHVTATPVNNRLIDLQHMIELFLDADDYFRDAPWESIHCLGHFRTMEKELESRFAQGSSRDGFYGNQSSRGESRSSLRIHSFARSLSSAVEGTSNRVQKHTADAKLFSRSAEDPQVVDYSIKKTYGNLLTLVEKAFNKESRFSRSQSTIHWPITKERRLH